MPQVTDETIDDPRYELIRRRDRASDEAFVYSVRTTGVYCRPSCAARLARRENVAFHADCAAAEGAGFRPCKRCRPTEPSQQDRYAALVRVACRAIEAAEDAPALADLARQAGAQRAPFPSRVPTHRGRDTEGLRRRASCRASAGGVGRGDQRHGGDLQCRLQHIEPVLRERRRPAGHDAAGLSRWRGWQRDPVRGGRMLARCHPGCGDGQGGVCDHAGGRSGGAGARVAGPVSKGRVGRRGPGVRGAGGARGGRGGVAGRGVRAAARHSRYGVPAARLAGAAGDPAGADGRVTLRSPLPLGSPRLCAQWRARVPPIRWRSSFHATG